MELPAILVSDTHLTASPADGYRWGLFPWLAGECKSAKARTLVVLGDLTDAKDQHPAELVNRVVRAVDTLRAAVPRIVVMMGNHDYLKAGTMFFKFLDALHGVEVITSPAFDDGPGRTAMFLPHTRQPAHDWAPYDFSHCDYVFMHQTVRGARSSNGVTMDGEPLPNLSRAGKVWSGDIHVPQVVGCVEYVGSPYHVHFGDAFVPRCVEIDRDGRAHDMHFVTVSRRTIDVYGLQDLKALELNTGDQVKVRLHIAERDMHEWRGRKAACENAVHQCGAELRGLRLVVDRVQSRAETAPRIKFTNPRDAVVKFIEADDLGGELLDAGLECMEI